jgi:magnesium-transporting ATPase (P-type)
VRAVLEGGVLCNDSALNEDGGAFTPNGAPTEVSLITAALKAGINLDSLKAAKPRVGSVPFESEHKFMATVHEYSGRRVLLVKGAPDRLLPMCSAQLRGDGAAEVEGAGLEGSAATAPLEEGMWVKAQEELSSQGLRVLALCRCVRVVWDRDGGFVDPGLGPAPFRRPRSAGFEREEARRAGSI